MTSLTISRSPASAGMTWIKEGWRLFKESPVPWAGMTALVFMVILGVNMIPWIGRHAIELLSPFLVAGYFSASRAALAGEPVTFMHLGAGMQRGRNTLLSIGGVYLVCSILVFALASHLVGADVRELLQQAQNPAVLTPEQLNQIVGAALPGMMLVAILLTPLLMATWFSPGLAMFEGFPPGRALWWSLWACWLNWRPLLVYSLVLGALGTVALVIPFGLGMLVFLPLTLISTFVAYRMIFTPIEDTVMEHDASP
ncbi:MAG: BPSS1780 family membrane protein [Pseudomonadota bacterium]|nr:BPSS1780 family membrane protein [Pseudomonadota bacterium]